MSAHASQAFSIAHCTDSKDLPADTLQLGSGVRVRVRVMARAWVRVRFRVVFCSNIAQFFTILSHSALRRCRMGVVVRLWLGSVVIQ